MRDERGIIMPLTLIIMVSLVALTMGLLAVSGMEPQVSQNLSEAAQARFAAEAGLEWGYNTLAENRDWNTDYLASADIVWGKQLGAAGQTIGNLPAGRGVYTVRVRNDHQGPSGGKPDDTAITGLAAKDASHTVDTNNTVILTAVGSAGSATKTLRAVVKKQTFPPGFFPGALNFPGNEAEVTFNGNSFEVDGRGWHTNGTLDSGCASAYGISVSTVLPTGNPGANEAAVEAALSSSQQDNVKGKKQNPSLSGQGNNTIVPDPVLTPEYISNFINSAKASADIVMDSTHASNGLSFSNIGDSCASDWSSQTCWGTADKPKIVWIRGEPDPTSMFSALQVSGDTEGHGILIVEDGDFRISGNFLWHGAIIVTGKWVGVGYMGGGNQVVYGAVISNETSTDPGFREGVVTGNAKIRYSCEALAEAMNSRKFVTVGNWKDLGPGE